MDYVCLGAYGCLVESPPTIICPAAQWLAGPPMGGPSVVCRIMQREDAQDDAIIMGDGNPRISSTVDASIYFGLCCGQQDGSIMGEPRADGSWPQHYTSCNIWQAEKEAVWADDDRAWTPTERYQPPVDEEDWRARIAEPSGMDVPDPDSIVREIG